MAQMQCMIGFFSILSQISILQESGNLGSDDITVSLQVEVFGSFKTGLYLPTSDIDVSACFLLVSFILF